MPRKKTDDARHKKVVSACKSMLVWMGFLQRYRLVTVFVDDLGINSRPSAIAAVESDYPYCDVTVKLKREFVDIADKEVIEETMLHEILHVELFGAVDRWVDNEAERGSKNLEYLNCQEEAVDRMTLWLTRQRHELGSKAWEV